jgi:hypothetical protein
MLKMGHTAGAAGQQGMLTPPRHLIPLPVFPVVRVSPFVYLTCNSYLNFETDYSSVSWPFHNLVMFISCTDYQWHRLYIRSEDVRPALFNNGLVGMTSHCPCAGCAPFTSVTRNTDSDVQTTILYLWSNKDPEHQQFNMSEYLTPST